VDTATGTSCSRAASPMTTARSGRARLSTWRLQLYVEPNALVIPSAAIVTGQQGSFVFVIQPDSSAASRPVTVNRTAGDYAVVMATFSRATGW